MECSISSYYTDTKNIFLNNMPQNLSGKNLNSVFYLNVLHNAQIHGSFCEISHFSLRRCKTFRLNVAFHCKKVRHILDAKYN